MLPLIVSGPNPQIIKNYLDHHGLLKNVGFTISTKGESIGIDDIKSLINETRYATDSTTIFTFLIEDGHLMTPPAQNALLKTLEEARQQQQFIITTTNHRLLLTTITSRCRLIILNDSYTENDTAQSQRIIKSLLHTPANLLGLSDQIIDHQPKKIIEDLIHYLAQSNKKLPTQKRTQVISLALTCLTDLSANVNSKLAVDHFLLKSHSVVTMNRTNYA